MKESFEVRQDHGQNSLVTIEQNFIAGYPDDKQILVFETDQSLHSNSDRAWNVMQAIETYANERGYKVQKDTEKFRVIAVYDEAHYSSVLEFKLRQQIKENPIYLEAAQSAQSKADQLNKKYGRHINELKRLVFLLEQSLDTKLKEVAANLVATQQEIIAAMNTEGIQDHHMFGIKHPLTKIEPSHYYKLTDNIPDNLDEIIRLLG